MTVPKATIGALSAHLKYWKTRARNVDTKRKRWRQRAETAEAEVERLSLLIEATNPGSQQEGGH